MAVEALEFAGAEQMTQHPTGVSAGWKWALTAGRSFASPDTADADEKARAEKKFTVNIRNMETPTASLWAVDIAGKQTRRLTNDPTHSRLAGSPFRTTARIGFSGGSDQPHERNITASNLYADLYLLDTAAGQIERLTKNREVAEGPELRLTVSGSHTAPDEVGSTA